MMDEFDINLSTEDGKFFCIILESKQNRSIQSAGTKIHYQVLKDDGFPIQITPWPDETDVQELIRIAVRIYQKHIKRKNETDGKS